MEKRKFYVHTDKQEMREAGVAKKQLEKLLENPQRVDPVCQTPLTLAAI